jgi:DNA-binding MarR family transcriptional regulator
VDAAQATDERDRRGTIVHLSDEGSSAIDGLLPLRNAIGECTKEMIASKGKELLSAIPEIDEHLEQQCIFSRVTERMKEDPN